MRERPILFSARLILALLEGRKTQTRRVLKKPPDSEFGFDSWTLGDGHLGVGWYCHIGEYPDEGAAGVWRCPYGKPGDQLYVREAHALGNSLPDGTPSPRVAYRATMTCGAWGGRQYIPHGFVVDGRTVHEHPENARGDSFGLGLFGGKWRPSIHMPRWASRIQLEVVSVRVERLQAITWRDALAEGIEPTPCHAHDSGPHGCVDCMGTNIGDNPVDEFAHLWDTINAKRGFGWDANPWLWVIEFKRLER